MNYKIFSLGSGINPSYEMSTLHITAGMLPTHSLRLFIGGSVKARFVFIRTAVCLFLKRVRLKYPIPISVR